MLSGALVARLDNAGDVLLTGPLVRAVAASEGPVAFMASANGAAAARLLPGVAAVLEAEAPWIVADPGPVRQPDIDRLVEAVASAGITTAVIATSFHQSPLPLALLLRLAGVGRIGAISVDYPGSLLDVRHRVADDIHEVERSLSLGQAMGYSLPAGDDGALRVTGPTPLATVGLEPGRYVVVHPGSTAPARTWPAERHRDLVRRLHAMGVEVAVTGSGAEKAVTAAVAGEEALDLGGRLDLGGLAGLLAGAAAVVCGNTGPAHLAAAVGTPVVSLYAPTVPAVRWRPWMVPHVLLGRQDIACAGCRARTCPVAGHPCLDTVTVNDVIGALWNLVEAGALGLPPTVNRFPAPAAGDSGPVREVAWR